MASDQRADEVCELHKKIVDSAVMLLLMLITNLFAKQKHACTNVWMIPDLLSRSDDSSLPEG